MIRLPRALRLDASDGFVFPRAAEPGEWAVPGSVLFWGADPAALVGKERAAFRAGFVGTASLGFTTLVEVAEIAESDLPPLVDGFAGRLLAGAGAPDRAAALAAAQDEVAFARSLCDHEPGTVIAMRRTVEDGAVREQFRTLHRRLDENPGADRLHRLARAFEFVEVEESEERVDLAGMAGER